MRCKTNHNIKFAYTNKTTDLFPGGHPLGVFQVIEKVFFNDSVLSLSLSLYFPNLPFVSYLELAGYPETGYRTNLASN